MEKWQDISDMKCSLCKKCVDSHEHLFFKCEFALQVWKEVMKKSTKLGGRVVLKDIVKVISDERSNNRIGMLSGLGLSLTCLNGGILVSWSFFEVQFKEMCHKVDVTIVKGNGIGDNVLGRSWVYHYTVIGVRLQLLFSHWVILERKCNYDRKWTKESETGNYGKGEFWNDELLRSWLNGLLCHRSNISLPGMTRSRSWLMLKKVKFERRLKGSGNVDLSLI
ncbi:hypothetical protein Tco_1456859 [Tanacetum coccineum]